jgi:hypothetical protein
VQVCDGRIAAAEGARRLGISRKSYYQWQNRGMRALVEVVTDCRTGRPPVASPYPETESLRKLATELDEQLQQSSAPGPGRRDDAAGLGPQHQINQDLTGKQIENQILEFLEKFEKLRMQYPRHSAFNLCQSVGLAYSTFRRWRSRWRANQPVIRRPGPPSGSARAAADRTSAPRKGCQKSARFRPR